ncbi:hypothetical protein LIER_07550 [Lithospermum erythrorhizon]|uniref:No apical meristem-associated C-terminal domain-containing protein n=1 Tax=Lithospermum erythrorhizon TaxID=34254 RepID=A0AAV3P992_LITER
MDHSFPYFHQQTNNPNNSKQQRPDFNINLGISSNTPISSYFPSMYGMPYQRNIPYMSYGQPPPPYGYSGGMQEPSRINKFIGSYRSAKKVTVSGWSEDDYLNKAHEIYTEDMKGKFNLMEEWKVFRDEPKYMINMQKDSYQSSRSKRGLDSEGGEMSISNTQHQCPQGRDASKRLKGKSKKISKVEVVEKAVECDEDYMAFMKNEVE